MGNHPAQAFGGPTWFIVPKCISVTWPPASWIGC